MRIYKKNSKIKLLNIFLALLIIGLNFTISVRSDFKSKTLDLNNTIYYSYNQLTELIMQFQDLYPDIFMFYSIGTTLEGRDIWVIKISDNVSFDEDESEVLFMGGVHGDEKPGYQTVIYSMKAIVENYSSVNVNISFTNRIRNIVNKTEIFFIPMVNPDGIESNTRKNKRINDCKFGDSIFCGVDINRNYGYKWEEFDKNPFKYTYGYFPLPIKTVAKYPFFDFQSIIREGVYRGKYPFSENESYAIKGFIENHSILIRIDYHTYGEKIIYPWYWTNEIPPDEPVFLSIAQNISKINGYQISQGSNWYYIIGNSGDWMYAEHNILTFTIELCRTSLMHYFPIKNLIMEICKNHLLVNLYIAERSLLL